MLPKEETDVKELLDTFGYLLETQDRRLPTENITHPVTGKHVIDNDNNNTHPSNFQEYFISIMIYYCPC